MVFLYTKASPTNDNCQGTATARYAEKRAATYTQRQVLLMIASEVQQQLATLKKELQQAVLSDASSVEAYRLRFVSKKGEVAALFAALKTMSVAEKKAVSPLLNQLKVAAITRLKEEATSARPVVTTQASEDLSLPPIRTPLGGRHPIQHSLQQAIHYFQSLGFEVAEGPEIESDWYNFTALNFPPHHPARDMQDTFFLEEDTAMLLRTHTSSVQVRMMEQHTPPLRMIMPGRVYRNETITARSHCFFHQIEGLYVDQKVSIMDMRHTLYYFCEQFFGRGLRMRLRASYFPFTEPSAELDIGCLSCSGRGCVLCKESGWLEVAGCGMVDPQVLQNCKINPEKYSGYAFGIGIDRLTLLRYGIDDIRLLTQGDVRLLRQFRTNVQLS